MRDEKTQFYIRRATIISRMVKALKETDRIILLNLDENDPVYIEAFNELESAMEAAQSFLMEDTVFSQTH